MSNVYANFTCKLGSALPHCIKNSILDFYWLLSVPIKTNQTNKTHQNFAGLQMSLFHRSNFSTILSTSQETHTSALRIALATITTESALWGSAKLNATSKGYCKTFRNYFKYSVSKKKKIMDNKIWTRLLTLVAQYLVYRKLNYGTYLRWFTCSGRWSVRAVLLQFFLKA